MHTRSITIVIISFIASINAQLNLGNDLKSNFNSSPLAAFSLTSESMPCNCAVFMNGQFKKGSKEAPKGHPALIQETDMSFPCTHAGTKQCVNKCLETLVKHLPNSPAIICGTIDRDCHRERAYLFTQHCEGEKWTNSNLSAGREYCCKDGSPISCVKASST